MDYANDMEVIFIDGLILTSDVDALKVLDASESNSVFISDFFIINFSVPNIR